MIERLYRSGELAVVSTQPAYAQPGQVLVSVARGPRLGKLTKGNTYGPYPAQAARAHFDELVAKLRGEGFVTSGVGYQLVGLGHSSAKIRARAAMRLGWLRNREAVDGLIAASNKGGSDICAITDALGLIGDPRGVAIARAQAARKLLSRRRSGVEALRNLGDAQGLAESTVRARERLDEKVLGALTLEQPAQLVVALLGVPVAERGLQLDTLYEIATPIAISAVLTAIGETKMSAPGVWRYVKSIWKRAMLRHDYRVFGVIAHAMERAARDGDHGATATVKSGLDGETRETAIFHRKTVDYVRRASWRYLRMIARRRPGDYALAAAYAVLPYLVVELEDENHKYPETSRLYLLHRVLYGGAKRFSIDLRTMRFVFVKKGAKSSREEAFPALWDMSPAAYVRILAEAKLPDAHNFALAAVERGDVDILAAASGEELLGFLDAPNEKTVELGLAELDRRFDARKPSWTLLARLLADERPVALEVGMRWLRLTAPLWTRIVPFTLDFVSVANPTVRALAVDLAIASLSSVDAAHRRAVAEKILARLRAGSGEIEGLARLGREALTAELGALVSLDEILALIAHGSPPAQGLAGALLAQREGALETLGIPRILPLAEHPVALVRGAAAALVRRALPSLARDPSLLLVMVETDWDDTRAAAISMLREAHLEALGLDGLIGLCDSNRVDVQNLGRDLVLRHFNELDPNELLYRLAQHPHANMRGFALELVEQHLPQGFVPLSRLEQFFRAALFQLWPEREIKDRVLEFLRARALLDENQAGVSAAILNDFVRTRTREDFERASLALVQIKLAFPSVETAVGLH